MIYLDNAATTIKKPEAVAEAVLYAMQSFGNAGRGAHTASLDASRAIYETRERLAKLFGLSDPARVVFTANATMALNITIQGIFNPGDHVITTVLEHNSVLRPLYFMERQGVELTILPADECGRISYEAMEEAIRPNTRGIVCTHASNLCGNLLDSLRIGELCRAHDLLFVLDASQTAGVFPIDMKKMNISVLCFTGHKSLMGPQGTGGLCVAKGVGIRPLFMGGSGVHSYSKEHPVEFPTALEAGTLNCHGIAGLHAALGFLQETGLDMIRGKEQKLLHRLYEELRRIPGVKIYGDFSEKEHAPIVAFNIRDYDSGEVADVLATEYDICCRAGAHCAPLLHEAFGTVNQGAVRFSLSYWNTEEEIDRAVQAVKALAEEK